PAAAARTPLPREDDPRGGKLPRLAAALCFGAAFRLSMVRLTPSYKSYPQYSMKETDIAIIGLFPYVSAPPALPGRHCRLDTRDHKLLIKPEGLGWSMLSGK
ncbi:hypothetical protein K0U00_48230, partial [Paenibacillus sepulcri]|nr:hypothetical protein [Paenibacillus sepulcri]